MNLFGKIKQLVKPFFSNKSELKPEVEIKQTRSYTEEVFTIVGIHYYEKNLKELRLANPDYRKSAKTLIKEGKVGRRIYHWNYIKKPVKLIPEPNNPHDKNAVAVYIAGELVGYISRDDNIHVKEILTKYNIKFISSAIKGGEFKIACSDETFTKSDFGITITVKIGYII